jgi:hypothetical protein
MAVLSSSASDARKLTALKYLGHWVGDLHQPLHVSFGDDRGGNNVSTSGECLPNLHSAWDTCLVLKAVGEDPRAAAADLVKSITPAQQELWTQASDPRDWANESFAITRAAATQYCLQQGAACNQSADDIVIDDAYIQANRDVFAPSLQRPAYGLPIY